MGQYEKAGVNIAAGNQFVKQIKNLVNLTKTQNSLDNLDNFGGIYNWEAKKLVASTDGVGTKLMIAQQANVHDSIGIDCVAMCVNDILAQGARPLFFLDYIATGKNEPDKLTKIISGVVNGCIEAKAQLIGGETAEMPDMYAKETYDIAGFAVGAVDNNNLITRNKPQAGDILIGLASSGLHSNGYSLVRKLLFKDHRYNLQDCPPELKGISIQSALLKPTKIYVQTVLPLLDKKLIHGLAHITGGGLIENVPRMFNDNLQATIKLTREVNQPIFEFLKQCGNLNTHDCYQTFNMGIGMVLAVSKENITEVKQILEQQQTKYFEIGFLEKKTSDFKISINGEVFK